MRSVRSAWRKIFFFCHLWIGLLLGLYFVLMGLTGSLLVFRQELDTALEARLLRVEPQEEKAPLSKVLQAIEAQYGKKASRLTLYEPPHRSLEAMVSFGKGESRQVYVNPYTTEVLGDRRSDSALVGFVLKLHMNLTFGKPGQTVSAYLALVVAWLLLTGWILWWPSNRKQLRHRLWVARKGTLKRKIHDLHNVFGLYSFPLLLVLVLTGTTFTFKKPIEKALYRLTGEKPSRDSSPKSSEGQMRTLDELYAIADAAAPGRTSYVFLPSRPGQTLRLLKELPGGASLRRRARVVVDPVTAEILEVSGIDQPLAKTISEGFAPIHFGHWGGWFSRALSFLAGLAPVGLFITGIWKYVYRRRARKVLRQKVASGASQSLEGVDVTDEVSCSLV